MILVLTGAELQCPKAVLAGVVILLLAATMHVEGARLRCGHVPDNVIAHLCFYCSVAKVYSDMKVTGAAER